MRGAEFYFPPDHVSNDVRTPSFRSVSPAVPFGVLARTPVSELPPTPRPVTPHRTIGQLLRGGLHNHNAARASLGSQAAAALPAVPRSTTAGTHMVLQESDDFWLEEPTVSAGRNLHADHSAALVSPAKPHESQREECRAENGPASHGSDTELEEFRAAGAPTAEEASGATQRTGALRHQRLDWTEKEVRAFYKALSQFGTDFGAIAVLFPNRQRNQVKKLYQREYRKHRADVLRALEKKEDIDMEAYQQLLAARKAREAPKKKKLAVSDEELLHEIASGALAPAATATTDSHGDPTSAESTHVSDARRDHADTNPREMNDLTVAEFVRRGAEHPDALSDEPAETPHRTSTSRKRARDELNDSHEAVGHRHSPATKPKIARHRAHEGGTNERHHEETLYEMKIREDEQYAHQTLLEAALDGEFGAVFPAETDGQLLEDADDFSF